MRLHVKVALRLVIGVSGALKLEIFVEVQEQCVAQLRQMQGGHQSSVDEVEQDGKFVFQDNRRNINKGRGYGNLGGVEIDFQT